jgi:hypothetical protein
MPEKLSEEELEEIRTLLEGLRLEHSDLDQAINHLVHDPSFEELKVKRLKKRRLQLKDEISRLKNKLIPDILA